VMGKRVANATSLAGLLSGPARPPRKVSGASAGGQGVALFDATVPTGEGSRDASAEDALATLVHASSGGLDLLRRIDELGASAGGLLGPRVEDLKPPGAHDVAGGFPAPPPRPLDDLQRGLLAAAGEVDRARRGRIAASSAGAPRRPPTA